MTGSTPSSRGSSLGGLYALFATRAVAHLRRDAPRQPGARRLAVVVAFMSARWSLATGWYPFWTLLVVVPVVAAGRDGAAARGLRPLWSASILRTDRRRRSAGDRACRTCCCETLRRQRPQPERRLSRPSSITHHRRPVHRVVHAAAVLRRRRRARHAALFFARTRLGRAMRATSDDPVGRAARSGIDDRRRVRGRDRDRLRARSPSPGCSTACRRHFTPASPVRELLIFAFEAVIIGGLGSLWGTLAGGIVLGVAQNLGAADRTPSYGELAGHLVFLAVLVVRPTGLFGARARA